MMRYSLSPLFFFFLFYLKFYFVLWGGGLQEQRADARGWEMGGIRMHDVKDTKIKALKKGEGTGGKESALVSTKCCSLC